jgi:hypothetical protein
MNTYNAARAIAQARANATGCDQAVEKPGDTWITYQLPARQFRFGHELRCEVVMCEALAKCRPGHGPTAQAAPGWIRK